MLIVNTLPINLDIMLSRKESMLSEENNLHTFKSLPSGLLLAYSDEIIDSSDQGNQLL